MNFIETIGERLKYLRKDQLKMTQKNFAEKINLARNSVAILESGERNVTDRTISDICRKFNVNEEWLRDGKGAIFKENDDITLDEYVKQKKATPSEIELFKAYLNLSDELRDELINFITSFGIKKASNTNIKVLEHCIEEEPTYTVFTSSRGTTNNEMKNIQLSKMDYDNLLNELESAPGVENEKDL